MCFNEINGTRLVTGLDKNEFVDINSNSFLAGCKYVYSIFNGLDAKVPGVTLARKIILSCFKAKLVTVFVPLVVEHFQFLLSSVISEVIIIQCISVAIAIT